MTSDSSAPVSLKRRYFVRLFANILSLPVNLVIQAVIPRGLGPKAYGDFNFLSNFFLQLMTFFSLSTSTGFYTKLSQRQKEFGLISFYFRFTALAVLALFLFTGVCQSTGWARYLWLGQKTQWVYLAAVWAVLTWTATLFMYVGDSYGLTVSTESARLAQRLVGLAVLLILFFARHLSLKTLFIYQYGLSIFLIALFLWIFEKNGFSFFRSWSLGREQWHSYVREFYDYSHPLFSLAAVGVVVSILERWFLQKFGGSVEQGFFGLSYQIAAACFIFTSAMTSLITREFSIAFEKKDFVEMARLFRRFIPLLYSAAAFFACFACAQASSVARLFGGAKYTAAAAPVMIMSLYPIHQTYGQLSGSVFFAAGQTRLYRNTGLLYVVLSLPIAYFLLAPHELLGLQAGAVGLAVKFVVVNFLVVNVQLFFNARFLKLRFMRYVAHQMISVGFLMVLALLSKMISDRIWIMPRGGFSNLLIAGFFYTTFAAICAYYFPLIFGLQASDVAILRQKPLSFIKEIGKGF